MKNIVLILIAFGFTFFVRAEVALPNIFNDNMVLQRDKPVEIWGKADAAEKIEVAFNGQLLKTEADSSGKWEVTLKPMAYGGPYSLIVKGENTIVLQNILIGDVWICSGQSNMEFPVKYVKDAKTEMAKANYPEIRSFTVKRNMAYYPLEGLEGDWTECNPETVGQYSAVGYFFARKVHEETGIPIALINTSWGGTQIETWTDTKAYKKLPAEYWEHYQDGVFGKDSVRFIASQEKAQKSFYEAKRIMEDSKDEQYFLPRKTSEFKTCKMPLRWDRSELKNIDGVVWFYTSIDLPGTAVPNIGILNLGPIDQKDMVWINGKSVGGSETYMEERSYKIPKGILQEGNNTIAVRLDDNGGNGGFAGKAEDLFLQLDNKKYSLAGDWTYRKGITSDMFNYEPNARNLYPGLLYNAMINPLLRFKIKGILWYQGEHNVGRSRQYRTLFSNMIKDWRKKWGEDLPFYWVQLPNYMKTDEKPKRSAWAELREAQTAALALPKTGEAVIIDVGEADDIHPKNKQDVGLRLALIALNKDYGRKHLVYSGPTLKSVKFRGSKVIVSFDHSKIGLKTIDSSSLVKGFAIAGADKKFVWARAKIVKNKVIVESDQVVRPLFIRYAWGNNPETNLYNNENLPASPFRTDNLNQ
ncbi:sialate O-acetylesterase [Maribacter luteus]|uniref:9-O-acetylesterase n=1 Tax=Maribacter luteus TaxID=2594478 RepID=A0A6I2MT34_9FLAO|nr:sialate O-acetylesterase [Maribacter luteus]MRX65384.1 9-O-acetylesterase [Maribacter luteus]